ncbi:MAG TPA: low temperature requirement protein A [Solirubrobacteraceae bacterium]|jgi:low temperature requirement protein LtrA
MTQLHLRPRGKGEEQPVTAVELLFDLVFVFAVTQLSHLVLADLTVSGLLHAGFLLLVLWWGWINTTWLANWLDPASTRVRLVLLAAALASLLLAAAIPRALGNRGLLFAVAYVLLQSGRNLAATLLAPAEHRLRSTFSRLLFWSAIAGVLWIAGGLVSPDRRLYVWGAALAVELCAPILGYPTPRLGRSRAEDYDIEGGHFAERCQGFVIIALGESIVVTGATAANTGLGTDAILALTLAFLSTATLWWLYFDSTAANSRADILASEQAGRLARDAFSYLHIPIIAGIIAVAVGDDLLVAHPNEPLGAIGAATALGGPALFLLGESLFRLRMIGSVNPRRLACVAGLASGAAVSSSISAFALVLIATAMLLLLALAEQHAARVATGTAANG